jgi:hypothetical protein
MFCELAVKVRAMGKTEGCGKCTVWMIVAWLVSAPAGYGWAQTSEHTSQSTYPQVQKLANQGTRLFKASEYSKARRKFEQAYELHPDPNLLYNIARCHEEAGELDLAIDKLGKYLAESDADPAVRRKAIKRLGKLQRLRSRMEAKLSDRSTIPPVQEPTAGSAKTNQEGRLVPPAAKPTASHKSPADAGISNWKLWKWSTLGVGAASAIGGGIVFSLGEADHRKVFNAQRKEPVTSMTQAKARDLVDSGNRKKTFGYIGMGTGGAILVGSLVLFLLEPKQPRIEQRTQLSVLPTNDGGWLIWSGRF